MNLTQIHEKYYNNVPYANFMRVVALDPTYNAQKPEKKGRYADWIVRLYSKGGLKEEDFYKVPEYLAVFEKCKSRLELGLRDVGKFSSLADLYDAIKPFMQQDDDVLLSRKELKLQGAKREYEDDGWLVVEPLTWEASKLYGSNTQWCTASKYLSHYFDWYSSHGKLLININKKTKEKFQMHFSKSGQFSICCDASDRQVTPLTPDFSQELIDYYDKHYTFSFRVRAENGYYIGYHGLKSQNLYRADDESMLHPLIKGDGMQDMAVVGKSLMAVKLRNGYWTLLDDRFEKIDIGDFKIDRRPKNWGNVVELHCGDRWGFYKPKVGFAAIDLPIESCSNPHDGHIALWNKDRVALMDENLVVHTDADYFRTHMNCQAGLVVVRTTNGFTYVDEQGRRPTCMAEYRRANPFSENAAMVADMKSGQNYFIDKNGCEIAPGKRYRYCMDFHNGRAVVGKTCGKGNYLTAQGELLLEHDFFRTSSFDGTGTAIVEIAENQFNYVDLAGHLLCPDQNFLVCKPFCMGYGAVRQADGTWNLLGADGKLLLSRGVESTTGFSRETGLAQITTYRGVNYVNTDGQLLTPWSALHKRKSTPRR